MGREEKAARLRAILDDATTLTAVIEEEIDGKCEGDTPENRDKLKALLIDGDTLQKSIENDNKILGYKSFLEEPVNGSKAYPAGGDGAISQPLVKTLGDQIIEQFQAGGSQKGLSQAFEAKGFFTTRGAIPDAMKATFDTTAAGLDTSRNYVTPPGGLVLIEQQRLTIRDLIPVGQTVQNTVYFPKETVYTNAATTVAEEGEKPEATLDIESSSAPVKKIAVLIKVSDEMWDDFPMLRDYVNSRLRFMVEQREEDQLLNGTGAGNNITGILNSGPQTYALSAESIADAIHKAMTKVKVPAANVGGYNPSGIVIHPTDWQTVRLAKDDALQYYGGGPFTGAYGNNGIAPDMLWGLPVVVTTAIAENTALVGDFRLGTQIFQRTGIDVKTFDQNEDDVNFNRKTIRVEERLALAVYRPSAFCTVTNI